MSSTVNPRISAGHFQWNIGGWLGIVVGGTAWMAVTAGFLMLHGQFGVAAIPLGCFVVSQISGLALWMRRDRLDPFFALMVIMSLLAVTVPVAWLATTSFGSPRAPSTGCLGCLDSIQ